MRKSSSSGTEKIAAGRALATGGVASPLMARSAPSQFPNLTVLSHPLIQHKLTILRAGLGMVEGISQLIPSARVGHIGLYRNHDTLQPVDYYFKIPSGEADRSFFLLDPMLATGGSAVAAVSALARAGAPLQRIRFLCLVSAPEGVKAMLAAHATVPIYTASLDRELNAKGYILPGLGDAGDRLFGTR